MAPEIETVTEGISDPAAMGAAADGVDAVVMTHRAPYGSGANEAVDYGAIAALLKALDGRQVRVALMTSIGVTNSDGPSRELLRWKQRGERLVRASGLPYTIVRPGRFDASSHGDHRVDLKQSDEVEYGPVNRRHVAETLVEAIHAPTATGKTLEVFSTPGEPISDWPGAFGRLLADTPHALDGARDRPGPPLEREPAEVQADLRRWS